jgi:tetratricopeptide (TPR) repeat protein
VTLAGEATFDQGLAAARRQVETGDSEGALWTWSALATLYPDRPEPLLRAAVHLRALKRYDEADALLLKGQEHFANELSFFFDYCHVAEIRGDKAEILRRWELALERVPHHPVSYSRVAGVLRDLQRYDEADAILLEAQARFPDEASMLMEHPRAAEARRDWSEALTRWDRARARYPDHVPGYVGAAAALRELGRLEEADALLLEARDRFPDEPALIFEHCRIAESGGDANEILSRWQIALDRLPDLPLGYSRVAGALRDLRRHDEADAVLSEAQAKFPDEPGMLLEFARVAEARKDWPEALRRWNLARERLPGNWQVYTGAAAAFRALKQFDDADAVLSAGLENLPTEPVLLFDYCRIAEAREEWPEAARRWSAAREKLPNQWAVLTGLAHAYRELGRFDEADAVLLEGQEAHPRDIELFIAYAVTAVVQRNLIEARDRWKTVSDRFPQDFRSYINRAQISTDVGDAAGAETAIAEALARFPDKREVLAAWADIASRRGDISEAERRYEAALLTLGNDFDLTIRLFDLRMALSKSAKAADLLTEARGRWPKAPELMRREILLALDQSDFDSALRTWQVLNAAGSEPESTRLDLAVSIFKAGPPIAVARPILAALVQETDTGERDWLPKFADVAAFLVYADKASPQWLAARSVFSEIAAADCEPLVYLIWKTALNLPLDETEMVQLFEGPLSQNRMALIAQIFSSTRTKSIPGLTDTVSRCFEQFIADLAEDTRWISYDNARQLLGYLIFATVYSVPAYRQLTDLARRYLEPPSPGSQVDATTPRGALAAILAQAPRHAAPATIARRSRPLRIAYCISGQLRGFRQAYQTWNRLGHDRENAEIFVHTWCNIGRNWNRTWNFLQPYPNLYAAIGSQSGITFLRERFPILANAALSASGASDTVDEGTIRDFYRTENVRVEDDTQGIFAGKPNVWKMYHKIEQAYRLAVDSGIQFDLFVRLRPDQNMRVAHEIDWERVAYESVAERALFVDVPFEFIDGRGILKLADAFAVGGPAPMQIFSTTLSTEKARSETGVKLLDSYRGLHSHITPAYDALYAGIVTKPPPPGLVLSGFRDPPMLAPHEVLSLLLSDVGGTPRDTFEQQLIAACQQAADAQNRPALSA